MTLHDHRQRPRLLAVSSELPWPLNAGGRLRTFHLLRAIARLFDVHLVVAGSAPDQQAIEALATHGITAEVVVLSAGRAVVEAAKAVRCAVTGQAYVLYGRHRHQRLAARVQTLGAEIEPAVIYLDHLDAYQYRERCPEAVAVIDLHNVYSLIANRWASEHRGLIRAYLRREASLLAAAERTIAADADLVFAVSEQERSYYRHCGGCKVQLVPNGVDTAVYRDLPTGREAALIVYVGSMSWRPNAEAAMLLASAILPRVRRALPGARLRIIGRDPTPELLALRQVDGVEVTGEVDDILPQLRDAGVLAVPLATGGGTRLKILEALAAGLPVVSTPVGAEGLGLLPGIHLLVAERDRFAEAVVQLLTDRALATAMATNGRALVSANYDWSLIGARAAASVAAAAGIAPPGEEGGEPPAE